MAFNTNEKLNKTDQLALQISGGANDSPGPQWWYSGQNAWVPILPPSKLWSDFDQIPGAATPAAADAAVLANSTILERVEMRLTLNPTTNNRQYEARPIWSDRSQNVVENWILPAMIKNLGGPSPGYSIRLYNGDPSGGGTELPTTYLSGAGGAPSWEWNYSMGLLLVSTDQSATYGAINSGAGLWVQGYRYIGPTGGAATTAVIYTYPFTAQTAITVPHSLGTRRILSYIIDDGTNDFEITGLAFTWVYTDLDTIDITFASPTSGIVVIGMFDGETFYGDYTAAVALTHEHAFNQNHSYTTFDPASFDDLRFALSTYRFAGPYEDESSWVAAKDAEFWLVAGMPRRHMQTFLSSTSWVVSHTFDTKDVFLSIQGIGLAHGQDIYSMANTVQRNQNDVTVTWATPQSGRIVVGTI